MKGRVTLPVDIGLGDKLKELAERWGADAVRNSDGTTLPADIRQLGLEVYSTLSLTRADQVYARANPDQYTQKYLISDPVTAVSGRVTIDPMRGHFRQQFKIDTRHDPKKWWEVNDRTTGKIVPPKRWRFDRKTGRLTVLKAEPYHVYTVSFLTYQVWDTTSMYNHLTNNWRKPHVRPLDPRQLKTRRHLRKFLKRWLKDNPGTDVVRFTSLIYHFTNNFSDEIRSRYRDWIGYHDCVSPAALNGFARAKGYRLRPEDITDEGYLNDVNRVPSKRYLDWMDYIHRTVCEMGREWTDLVHGAKRQTMMFYCDHHVGTEPYGPYFKNLKMDRIVNPCMNGIELRRIADIPVKIVREVRLYPYFFPLNLEAKPSFAPGGDPTTECKNFWVKVRRAMVQNPVDRIGFGGYPSLALKFPKFIDYVAELCDEFRAIHEVSAGKPPAKAPFKVGILNCWGKLRSWIDAEINNWTKPYQGGILESLSGMNLDVEFLNFDDIAKNGVPEGMKVLINDGDAGTAWSGGRFWADRRVVEAVRRWVREQGGGFIGVRDPSAFKFQGRYFQLADVLGVERETGEGISAAKSAVSPLKSHFITQDQPGPADLGTLKDRVYRYGKSAQVLLGQGEDVHLSANRYGRGRAVYMAGFAYGFANTRLLARAIFWAAGRERDLKKWFSSNIYAECAAFPATGRCIVINNSGRAQRTLVYDGRGRARKVSLKPYGSHWFSI